MFADSSLCSKIPSDLEMAVEPAEMLMTSKIDVATAARRIGTVTAGFDGERANTDSYKNPKSR